MPQKIIDISMPIENEVISDPPGFGPKITYFNHKDTLHQMTGFLLSLKNPICLMAKHGQLSMLH